MHEIVTRPEAGSAKAVRLQQAMRKLRARPFEAPYFLRNRHAMTIIGAKRPRRFSIHAAPAERREFATEPGTRVLAWCHWQPQRKTRPTVIVIHGLEGSSEGSYVLGTAGKAYRAGFNVLRVNVRGCGGTAHMARAMYHSGLTTDWHAVLRELIEQDEVTELFIIGFSMGGNQTLKLAGELGADAPSQLRGVCAISPPIDLESCSLSIREPENWLYEYNFIHSLRKTMIEKDRLYPGHYDLSRLHEVRHLWDWDEIYQRYNGFDGARDYYARASSIGFMPRISIPALIIAAEDDPFIPFAPFTDRRVRENPMIGLLSPRYGGHVAFCGVPQPDEDRAWAENRAVEFCTLLADRL